MFYGTSVGVVTAGVTFTGWSPGGCGRAMRVGSTFAPLRRPATWMDFSRQHLRRELPCLDLPPDGPVPVKWLTAVLVVGAGGQPSNVCAKATSVVPNADGKHGARLPCRRREERSDLLVVKRRAGSAQRQRVGGQIKPAAEDPGLQLRRAVTAGAECRGRCYKVGHQEDHGGSLGQERLLQTEVAGVPAEGASLDQNQFPGARVQAVGAGR